MKSYILFLTTILCLFASSCKQDSDLDDGVDSYTPPFSFEFIITDSNGNNYIDRDDRMQIIKDLLTIDYKGHSSVLKAIGEPAIIIGPGTTCEKTLRVYPEVAGYNPENLLFGGFSYYDIFKNEEFTINWCDGTKDVVRFDHYIDKKKNILVEKYYINGKETTEKSMGFGGALIRKTIDTPSVK